MRSYDNTVNSIPGVTCRVWLFRIYSLLLQNRLVRCDNVNSLEQECKALGNDTMMGAWNNLQPRPVKISQYSS